MPSRPRTRSRHPLALTLALAVASLVALPSAAGTAEASSPDGTLAAYVGARNVDRLDEFEDFVGHRVSRALDFLAKGTWSNIENPSWWADGWTSAGYRVTFSVPMIPDSGGSIQAGARGEYNGHFVKLAQNLVAHGQADATLRLGWEFNGSWYRWSAKDDPAAWAEYWREIVTAMRSVPGQGFEFDWCPNIGATTMQPDRAYPGDAYVDYIGMDTYDQSWIQSYKDPQARWQDYLNRPYGLEWHREFAARHGKPMTYPEWGLTIRSDGHGGGDAPYYVEKMHDWIRANDVAYHSYFEYDAPDGKHSLLAGHFPRAASEFKRLFGAPGGSDEPADPPDDGAGDPPPGEATGTVTETKITKTPRRQRGRIKGAVRGAAASDKIAMSGGTVSLRLYHRQHGHWRTTKPARSTRVDAEGRFHKSLRLLGGRHLEPGAYRVRARYRGTSAGTPSASRFHKFKLG